MHASPEVENDRLLGNLVPNAIDGHILKVVARDFSRLPQRHDYDVAVVASVLVVHGYGGRLLRLALLGLSKSCVSSAFKFEDRRERTRTWSE